MFTSCTWARTSFCFQSHLGLISTLYGWDLRPLQKLFQSHLGLISTRCPAPYRYGRSFFQSHLGLISTVLSDDREITLTLDLSIPSWSDFNQSGSPHEIAWLSFQSHLGLMSTCGSEECDFCESPFNPILVWFQPELESEQISERVLSIPSWSDFN